MASVKIDERAMCAKSPPPPPKSPLVIARSNPRADIDKMASYLRSNRSEQSKNLRINGGHLVEDFFDASDRKELGHDFLAAALDQVAEGNEELRVMDFAAKWSIDEVNGKFPSVMSITDIHTAFGGENVRKFGSAFLELALKFIKGAFKQTVDDYNQQKGRLAQQQSASSGSVTNSPEAALSALQHETTESTPVRSETNAKEGDRAAHLFKSDQAQHLEKLNTPRSTIQELPSARYRSVRNNQQGEPNPYAHPSMQHRLPHGDASAPRVTKMNVPASAVAAAPAVAPGQGDRAPYAVQTLPLLRDPVVTVPMGSRPPNLTFPTTGMPMRMAPMADQIVAAGVYSEYGQAYPHMFVGPAFQPGSPMLGPQLQHPYFGNQPGFRNRVYDEPSSIETPRRDSFSSVQRGQRRPSFGSQTGLQSSARYRGSGTSYASRTRRDAEESHLDRALEGQTARQPRLSFSSDRARPHVDRPFAHQFAEAFAENFVHADDMCDEKHIGKNRTEVTELYVRGFSPNASQDQIARAIAEQVRVPLKDVRFSASKYSASHVAFAHFHNNADTRAALAVGFIMLGDRPIQLAVPRGYHGPRRDYRTSVKGARSHVTSRGSGAYGEPQQRTEAGRDLGSSSTSRRFSEPARHGPVYVSQSTREHYAKDGRVPTQEVVIEEEEEEEARGTYSSQDARSSPQKSRMTSFGSSFGEGLRSPQKRRTGSSSQAFASRRASSVQDSDSSRNQKTSKQQDRHKGNTPVATSPAKEFSGRETPKTDRPGSGSDEHEDQSPPKRLDRLRDGTPLSSHITTKPIDGKPPHSPSSNIGIDVKNSETLSKQRSGQEQQLSMPFDLSQRFADFQSPHNDPFSGNADRVRPAASADDLAALTPASRSTLPQVPLFESNALQGPVAASGPTLAISDETALAVGGRAHDKLTYTHNDNAQAVTDATKIGGELPLFDEPDKTDSLPVSHVAAGNPSKLEKGKDNGETASLVPQSMLSKKPKMKKRANTNVKLKRQHSNSPSKESQLGQRKETQLPVKTGKQSGPDEILSKESKQTSGQGGSTSPSTQLHSVVTKPESDTAGGKSETEQIQCMSTSEAAEQSTIEEPHKLPVIEVQRTEVRDQSNQLPVTAVSVEELQASSAFIIAAQSRGVRKPESERLGPPENIEETGASSKMNDTQSGRIDEVPKKKKKNKSKKKSKAQIVAPATINEDGTVPLPDPGNLESVATQENLPQALDLSRSTEDSQILSTAPEFMAQRQHSGDSGIAFTEAKPSLRTPIISLDIYLKTRAMLDNAIEDQHKLPHTVAMRGGSESSSQQHAMEDALDDDSEAGREEYETSSQGRKAEPEVEVALHQATSVVEASATPVPLDRDDAESRGATDDPNTLRPQRAHRRDSVAEIVDAAPGSVGEAEEVNIRGSSTDKESAVKSQSEGRSSDIEISQSAVGTTAHEPAEIMEMQQVGDCSERRKGDVAVGTSVTGQNTREQSPSKTARRQSDNSVTKDFPAPKPSWAAVASGGSKFNAQTSGRVTPSQGKAVAVHGSVALGRDKDGTGKALPTAQEDPWLATEAPWTDRAKTAVLADRVRNDMRVAVPRISFPKKEGKVAGGGKDGDPAAEPVRSQQRMARGKENLSVGEDTRKKDDATIYQRRKDGTFTKGG